MQLIAEKLDHGARLDRLTYVRADGTSSRVAMPRQGILAHDLVHWLIESRLGLRQGFTAQIARGAEPAFVMQAMHVPEGALAAEAAQAESLVEALQAQLWSGVFDPMAFVESARAACAMRGVPPCAPMAPEQMQALFDAAVELYRQWSALAPRATLTLDFPAS